VSGAHFNPAVTFAIWLSGRNVIEVKEALMYVAAQLAGGVSAGFTYVLVMGKAFPLGPVGAYTWFSAALAEIVFTAVLCFVVLSVATTATPSKDMFGLAIGSCVTVGGFAIGGISGGSMNPAVSLGIDVAHAAKTHSMLYSSALYTVFELAGATLATAAFYGVQKNTEYEKGGARLPLKGGK
jgi:aquaporin Z